MELVVEDEDGRVLGERDLEGSRWEQRRNHFTNLQDVTVPISVRGSGRGSAYIRNGNQRIGSVSVGSIEPGSSLCFHAGRMELNWHEEHSPVPDDSARRGQIEFQIEFTRSAADDVRDRAAALQILLARRGLDIPPEVREAGNSLLAAVDDLLAGLKVCVS